MTRFISILFALLIVCCDGIASAQLPPPIGGSSHCPANGHLARMCPAAYANVHGDSMDYGDARPDCCLVEHAFFDAYDQPNTLGLSEMVMIIGQTFWSHTVALTPESSDRAAEALLSCTPNFRRAPHNDNGEYTSLVSGCTDASFVYGSSKAHSLMLRAFVDGLLREHTRIVGYPPVNCPASMGMLNPLGLPASQLFCLGDVRGNENVFLTSLHILFFREHNRLARALKQAHPTWSDQQLFDKARALVIAQQQKIAFYDYTAAILGEARVPRDYDGYKDTGPVAIPVEFSQAVFRINHAQIANDVLYFVNDGVMERFSLERFFFNIGEVASRGIDGFLQGLLHQPAQEIGWRTATLMTSHHIIAADVCRSRDFGMPDYKTAAKLLLNKHIESVSDITSDMVTQYRLTGLYGTSMDNIDLFIGGLSEDKLDNAQMGPLFAHIYLETIRSVRDCDPYWFENDDYAYLDEADKQWVWQRTLADVILDNTALSCVQSDALHMPHMSEQAYSSANSKAVIVDDDDAYFVPFIATLGIFVLATVVTAALVGSPPSSGRAQRHR
jgi:hypothetical protein